MVQKLGREELKRADQPSALSPSFGIIIHETISGLDTAGQLNNTEEKVLGLLECITRERWWHWTVARWHRKQENCRG